MEINSLEGILESLNSIQIYLRKIGPERRKGEIFHKKLSEAQSAYSNFKSIANSLKFSDIPSDSLESFQKLSIKIESTFQKIIELDKGRINTSRNMENFDLKTATSLLPVLDDNEKTTEKLIDAIEFYDSMLNADQKQYLIKFILKTRLSSSAKLRLNSEYVSTNHLIEDMRSRLLTIKSDTTLQSKLIHAKQGNRSIENFGKSLEELFVDLTISQAKGDTRAYEVLKPVNERNAIKQFADGLKNERLSTIIAARNYTSLKDAIRAAQDENAFQNESPQIFSASYTRGRGRNNTSFGNRNEFRNRNFERNQFRSNYNRGNGNNRYNTSRGRRYHNNGYRQNNTQQVDSRKNPPRMQNSGQRRSNNNQIFYADGTTASHSSENEPNQFFREQ